MDSLQGAHAYGSEFEYDSEYERDEARRRDLRDAQKPSAAPKDRKPARSDFEEKRSREAGRTQKLNFFSLDAYTRHKKLVNAYFLDRPGQWRHAERDTSRDRTDRDVIRDNHRFLWDDVDAEEGLSWEQRLAKRYWDKLFKEYCIADLSRYKENKIALRWRVEAEVVSGKGQFACGNKRCQEARGLKSWEVNFGYVEAGEKRNALVKVRLCAECSQKLNHHHQRREVRPRKRKSRKKGKRSRRTDGSDDSDDVDEEGPDGKRTKVKTEESGAPEEGRAGGSSSRGGDEPSGSDVWRGPVEVPETKTREDEFDEYLADMLL